jgi:NADH-quinone oxidoreductase subunit E
MLSIEEREEIESHLSHYPQKQAACIDAMKIVQRRRGWISDEAIKELAEFFHMNPSELDSVATFYNLLFRKPVGRHVILACDSVSCWIMGADQLRRSINRCAGIDFGETSTDGRFTLLPVPCLGACEQAPALLIDDDLVGNANPRDIDQVLQRYR